MIKDTPTIYNYHKAREIIDLLQKNDKEWKYKIICFPNFKAKIEAWDLEEILGYL